MTEREWNTLTPSQQQSFVMMISAFRAGTLAFFEPTKASLNEFFDNHEDALDMMIRIKRFARAAQEQGDEFL